MAPNRSRPCGRRLCYKSSIQYAQTTMIQSKTGSKGKSESSHRLLRSPCAIEALIIRIQHHYIKSDKSADTLPNSSDPLTVNRQPWIRTHRPKASEKRRHTPGTCTLTGSLTERLRRVFKVSGTWISGIGFEDFGSSPKAATGGIGI